MSEWISVKDRLPKIGVEVLIFDADSSNDFHDVWSLARDEEYDDIGWNDKNGDWYYLDDVTHWMPLPEPPQKENRPN